MESADNCHAGIADTGGNMLLEKNISRKKGAKYAKVRAT